MNKYDFLKQPLVLSTQSSITTISESAANGASAHARNPGLYDKDTTNGNEDIDTSAGPSHDCQIEEDWDSGDLVVISNPFMARALEILGFSISFKCNGPLTDEMSKPFKPTMAHQIFGSDEIINGYRNLDIKLIFLANSFHAKIEMKYDEIRDDPARGEIADNIKVKFSEWLPNLIDDHEEFAVSAEQEDYQLMYGETVLSFQRIDENGSMLVRINKCDVSNPEFASFHKRFQSLIVFYIDAASMIDMDDPNWLFFYMYHDIKLDDGSLGHVPIGYCTVYMFAVTKRARIAQLFILPNFQMKGYGTRLLGAVYHYFDDKVHVQTITVESPCEEFTGMRDKLDLRLIINDPNFACDKVIDRTFKAGQEKTCKDNFKICALQARRLHRILLCFYSSVNKDNYKYVMYVKRDFYINYKRQYARINTSTDFDKVQKVKRTLKDNIIFGKRLHKDYRRFIKSIQPQFKYINKLFLLNKLKNQPSLSQ